MTTVAFDGRHLVADRQATSGNLRRTTSKIVRCGDYWYVGVGRQDDIAYVAEWLAAGAAPDKRPTLEEDGAQGIAVRVAGGALFVVQGKRPVLSPAVAPTAEGSGRDFAIAAMALGKSAREAVRLAARFDVYTGSEVDAVRVRGTGT